MTLKISRLLCIVNFAIPSRQMLYVASKSKFFGFYQKLKLKLSYSYSRIVEFLTSKIMMRLRISFIIFEGQFSDDFEEKSIFNAASQCLLQIILRLLSTLLSSYGPVQAFKIYYNMKKITGDICKKQ